jgi:GDP-L-fucose synthase
MHVSDPIYVAGHTGLLGSALVRRLRVMGYDNLLLATHRDLDLTDSTAVQEFFARERPQFVFLAAAKVGGILANSTLPANFIFENIRIQTNVIHEAYRSGVKRLLFAGSSCIYPRLAPQPLCEGSLLTGPLEFTNRPYAVAKIAGVEMCWAYNRQYNTRFLAAMLTNLYGPGDNYHASNSHLIPALIRKMHEAKVSGAEQAVVWGTGTPRREFLYSDDAADACIFLLNLSAERFAGLLAGTETPPLVNVGWGADMTVREVAELVAEVVGLNHSLTFDPTKPDGTPRKLMNTNRLNSLGWYPRMALREGLREAYKDFCARIPQSRSTLEVGI